jgi:hypothetical protein
LFNVLVFGKVNEDEDSFGELAFGVVLFGCALSSQPLLLGRRWSLPGQWRVSSLLLFSQSENDASSGSC